jgi:hypothetical protein
LNRQDQCPPSGIDSGAAPLRGIRMCTSHRLDRKIRQLSIFSTFLESLTENPFSGYQNAIDPQATPNLTPKQTSHKRRISEAIPRSERLNSPETAPAAALEQGPEHTKEDTQKEGATGTGPRKSGRARRPKQRN